jgi:hypothetical protein
VNSRCVKFIGRGWNVCMFVCLLWVTDLCYSASRFLLSFCYRVSMILFNCKLIDVCTCWHTPLQLYAYLYMLPHTITIVCVFVHAATHHYNCMHICTCCHTPLQLYAHLYMLPHTITIVCVFVHAATHHYNCMRICACCHTPLQLYAHFYMLPHTITIVRTFVRAAIHH